MIPIVVAFFWLAAAASSASAQSGSTLFGESSRPSYGGVGLPPPVVDTPTFGASSGTEMLRHRGPTGRPCLTVGGLARPHLASPNVYDHVITAENSCAQSITIKVCYYNSDECIPLEVPGGERKEAILGTLPAMSDFRFEFREQF